MPTLAEIRPAIDRILAPWLSRHRYLTVSVGILLEHEQAAWDYGSLPAEGTARPGDLLFEIGSVTKVFTASLLAILEQQERLHLNDPIRTYLPDNVAVPSLPEGHITLEHLSTHTSGLPRLPSNLKITRQTAANPYADYTVEQLYAFLSSFRLKRPLPAPPAYSNLGVGLLGHILAERILGLPYEEAVRRYVCEPLGMADTGVSLTAGQRSRLVPGHSSSGKPVPAWDLPTLAGAGALRSSAGDLVKFLAAHLGLVETPLTAALQRCHTPRTPRRGGAAFGLGWLVEPMGPYTCIWHNGATGGYNAYAGFVPAKRTGVCVLTNRTIPLLAAIGLGRPVADAIGQKVLQLLL